MSRLVEVDLDDAAGLELLWMELRRHRAIREADPELRHAILRRVDGMTDTVVPIDSRDEILRALDRVHPAVVLEAFFTTLVPDRETIGAVRRRRMAEADA